MEHVVFVYGTLKRGFSNHFYLEGSEFLGEDFTKDRYFMSVFGGIPFVFRDSSESKSKGFIKGEVYIVDGSVLCMLDELEGHPDEYKREIIDLKDFGKAWFYFYPHFSLGYYKGRLIRPVNGVIEFAI